MKIILKNLVGKISSCEPQSLKSASPIFARAWLPASHSLTIIHHFLIILNFSQISIW